MVQPLLTPKEVARLLDIDEITVYRLARKGQLPAMKVGGQWRFGREALEVWMAQQMRAQRPSDPAMPGGGA